MTISLTLAKRAMEIHGWRIQVRNKPSKSLFLVYPTLFYLNWYDKLVHPGCQIIQNSGILQVNLLKLRRKNENH
jgi:hypothetical protein